MEETMVLQHRLTRKLSLLGLLLLLPLSLQAQTPVSSPSPTPVSTPVVASCAQANVGVEYVHFTKNNMSGTMEEATHPFTDCTKKYVISGGIVLLQVPTANSSYYMMGPRVDLPLVNIWPSIDKAFSSVTLFGGDGLGTAQIAPPNVAQTNHFAYGARFGVSASPGSIFGVSTTFLVDAGIIGYNGNVLRASVLPNAAGQIAAAVIFNLGNKTPSAAVVAANTKTK